MPFNWKDYLELAKKLNVASDSEFIEARKRTVVSRSFFAAFCSARDFAVKNANLQITNTDQDYVIVFLHYKTHGKNYNIYRHLNELRRWRNSCDYTTDLTNIDKLVADSIVTAEKIIHSFHD